MNIGLFSDTYFPDTNGVVVSILTLEKKLRERGHNVYIITTTGHEKPYPECNLLMLKSMPLAFHPSYRFSTFYSFQNAKKIEDMNLDIIHTNTEFSCGIFAALMAARMEVPMVHTFHTMWEDYIHYIVPSPFSEQKTAKVVTRRLIRTFTRQCSGIIAPSQAIAAYLKEKCGIKKPISVIPTGIDLEPFKKERYSSEQINALKQRYGLQGSKVILFIGRLGKEKSIDLILKSLPDVFEKNPDAKMLIVGGGTLLQSLQNLARELGIADRVVFAGEKPFSEIGLHYQLGDVFVMASTTETQGLTYIEAMASGIPVVAKKAPNLNGVIVDGYNGYLFTEDDSLVQKINFVLQNPELQKTVVDEALKTAVQFSSDRFADEIEKAYKRAIRRCRRLKIAHRMLIRTSEPPHRKLMKVAIGAIRSSGQEVTRVTRSALDTSRSEINRVTKKTGRNVKRITLNAFDASRDGITRVTKSAGQNVKQITLNAFDTSRDGITRVTKSAGQNVKQITLNAFDTSRDGITRVTKSAIKRVKSLR